MKRTIPLFMICIFGWFGLVALACNLGSPTTLPPTLVPVARVTDTPLPPITFSTLSPTELPQQQSAVNQPVSVAPAVSSDLQNLLNQIDPDRLFIHISTLAGFGTRHVNSPTNLADQGLGAAYNYVSRQFQEIQQTSNGDFTVLANDFRLTWNGLDTIQNNVVGILGGKGVDGGIIVIGAHYDSISMDPLDASYPAPGANDNASGVAALIEIARLMSTRPHRATVIFVAFAAEEVGRQGSRAFIQFLQKNNIRVDAMLNMDIIGSQTGPLGQVVDNQIRLYSGGTNEGPDSGSRQLARAIGLIDTYYMPNMQVLIQSTGDREGRYSDHLSFSDVGFPAVRFVEAMEDRSRQHTPQDTIDDIQATYLMRSTQTVFTVATVLADGLPPPRNIVLRANDQGTRTLVWEPVPGATGYLIALRRPGSIVYDQSFPWPNNSVDWDGFVSSQFAGLAITSINADGLIGSLSPEYIIP
ncbi:MAG: M20/M25/M40 family metallo-hydrolase [Anaerolineae bacterium]|nr:M20/M25/M40 family metallo-hydrolase [Anaerolineae bacterium]